MPLGLKLSNRQVAQSRMRLVLCANSSHAAFSLFALVVQGMLFSNHSDAGEQKSTTPQAALKAACGCGATCLISWALMAALRLILSFQSLNDVIAGLGDTHLL
jgi:hypothetical protein